MALHVIPVCVTFDHTDSDRVAVKLRFLDRAGNEYNLIRYPDWVNDGMTQRDGYRYIIKEVADTLGYTKAHGAVERYLSPIVHRDGDDTRPGNSRDYGSMMILEVDLEP